MRFWRDGGYWQAGWQRGDWWLSACRSPRNGVYLDIGKVRIRWASPEFRPLFSERYGHQKWHKAGRLGVRVIHSRKVHTP